MIPATGVVGLAVKAYLYVFRHDDLYAEDCAALAGREPDKSDEAVQLKLGLLKDIVAFAPELGPLAARFIEGLPCEEPPKTAAPEPISPRMKTNPDLDHACARLAPIIDEIDKAKAKRSAGDLR
jgi:hypothetical protein